MAYSQELATATIAMEASGEGEAGMLAVAFVLINRLKDGRWGDNLASVVLARKQFSCWNSDDPNRERLAAMKNTDPALTRASGALSKAMSGYPDPTLGATHYYAVNTPEPIWAIDAHFLTQIGNQRFYDKVK